MILVVEDVPELREWLRSLIAARFPEYRLRAVGSAAEFHLALERERPRLVILDEVLGPGEDLASLLKMTSAAGLAVSLMTGMIPSNRSSEALPNSVARRIIKPRWESGEGTEDFLGAVAEVIALTNSAQIG